MVQKTLLGDQRMKERWCDMYAANQTNFFADGKLRKEIAENEWYKNIGRRNYFDKKKTHYQITDA